MQLNSNNGAVLQKNLMRSGIVIQKSTVEGGDVCKEMNLPPHSCDTPQGLRTRSSVMRTLYRASMLEGLSPRTKGFAWVKKKKSPEPKTALNQNQTKKSSLQKNENPW